MFDYLNLATLLSHIFIKYIVALESTQTLNGAMGGRDRMVVGLATTYAISFYHHLRCEFESHSWRAVLDTTLCDKVCQ